MVLKNKNLFIEGTCVRLGFTSKGGFSTSNYPIRSNPREHAKFIEKRLQECQTQITEQRKTAAFRYRDGLYLEFKGKEANDLNIKSLENIPQGIRLLNVRQEGETTKATVFVPSGKEGFFLDRVTAFDNSLENNKTPKYNDLIRSIEDVRLAVLESFWVGNKAHLPQDTAVWCEVWLRFSKSDKQIAIDDFLDVCNRHSIQVNSTPIFFPERLVFVVLANRQGLNSLIVECSYIAEFRRAPELSSFFESLPGKEQSEWILDLLNRTDYQDSGVSICLLDTGIAKDHPLLSQAVYDNWVQSVNPSWGTNDHLGHGTEMAGLALFYDLKECLISKDHLIVPHKLESVKILPPKGENPERDYGFITAQAIAIAEIENPSSTRNICLAITAPKYNIEDGSPSSWSGEIDNLAAGVDNQTDNRRLILISAGNVCPEEFASANYPNANILHSVENPGQAWNALTVGAYNDYIEIENKQFSGFHPVADVGELSPYSSTSSMWDSKWPIKPEILLNGGNIATNGTDYSECPDFSLLSTSKDFLINPFSSIWATSAATAQASWMAAQICIAYPGIWPETVRGLIVHSARWTQKMKDQFCSDDKKSTGRKELLRTCGYGIPNVERAIFCLNNSVNMIIQGELQPYKKEGGRYVMNEMHIHSLPWPKEVLADLGETEAELRITLSYFIEPGPGEIGWKDKYRYSSCGLRFDIINNNESEEDFKKRVNVLCRGDDKKDSGEGTSGSERWFLGPKLRDVGSIHSDHMIQSGVQLSEINQIAVYPVIGWWRERGHLNQYNKTVKYALIVSISTPQEETDLYTAIIDQIQNPVEVNIPVK